MHLPAQASALLGMVRVFQKKLPEAEQLIARMIADGHDGYAVRMKSADIAEARKDTVREKTDLEAASNLDPTQVEPIQGLFDLAHKQQNAEEELRTLKLLASLDQHDRKVWGMYLERLVKSGQWEEAAKIGEGALFVDVANPKIHRLYARALARTGRFVTAVYELNSAIVCKPKPKITRLMRSLRRPRSIRRTHPDRFHARRDRGRTVAIRQRP